MNDTTKQAKITERVAMLNTAKELMFNPVVEFVAGMYLIDQLYPDQIGTNPGGSAGGSGSREVVTVQGPLGIGSGLKIIETDPNTGYTSTIGQKSTKGDWARDTLKWIILLQQIGPYAPAIVSGAGSAISGIAGAVTGVLTKGAVK